VTNLHPKDRSLRNMVFTLTEAPGTGFTPADLIKGDGDIYRRPVGDRDWQNYSAKRT